MARLTAKQKATLAKRKQRQAKANSKKSGATGGRVSPTMGIKA